MSKQKNTYSDVNNGTIPHENRPHRKQIGCYSSGGKKKQYRQTFKPNNKLAQRAFKCYIVAVEKLQKMSTLQKKKKKKLQSIAMCKLAQFFNTTRKQFRYTTLNSL